MSAATAAAAAAAAGPHLLAKATGLLLHARVDLTASLSPGQQHSTCDRHTNMECFVARVQPKILCIC